MDIWSLVPFVLFQLAFYISWIVFPAPEQPVLRPLNFVLPKINPVAFHSQWPFTSPLTSLVYFYGSAFLTLPGRLETDANVLTFISDLPTQAFEVHMQARDVAKIAPVGLGYMFFLGTSGQTIQWTQAIGQSGQSGSAGQSGSSGSAASRPTQFSTVKQTLDPVVPIAVSMSELSSFITIESSSTAIVRFWSDEYSVPTFGRYVMQTFLEMHTAFSLVISELNNTFEIHLSETSTVLTVTLPISSQALRPLTFLSLLKASIAAVYGNLFVELDSIQESTNALQVATLSWSVIGQTVNIVVPNTLPLINQCATAAMLGLYDFGASGLGPSIVSLEVVLPSAGSPIRYQSPGPVIVQWPVGFPFQRTANPGSHNTDGFLAITFSASDPLTTPDEPSIRLAASEYTYRLLGPTQTLSYSGFLSSGSVQNKPVEVEVRLQANSSTADYENQNNTFTILGFGIKNEDPSDILQATSHSISVNGSSPVLFSTVSHQLQTLSLEDTAYLASVSTGTCAVQFGPETDCTLVMTYHDTPGLIPGSDTSLVESIGSVSVRLVLEPFGYKTTIQKDLAGLESYGLVSTDEKNALAFGLTSQASSATPVYMTIEAWAGGGGTLYRDNTAFYGGASSRLQMTLELRGPIESIEAKVGLKGIRLDDSWTSGGGLTSLRINNIPIFVLGGGGGSAIGSHGGQGGGPIGPIIEYTLDQPGNFLQLPGYSGSVEAWTIDANTQVTGFDQKPVESSENSGSGSGSESSSGIQTWQGSGGSSQSGSNGYILDANSNRVPSRRAASGGLGSWSFSAAGSAGSDGSAGSGFMTVRGGQGSASGAYFGAGGGGPTSMLNTGQITPTLSIIHLTVNGPWTSRLNTSGPLGGGYGPFVPYESSAILEAFQQRQFPADSVSILNELENQFWPRHKVLEWNRSLLSTLARTLFKDGSLAESKSNTWTVSDAFVSGDDASTAYVPIGPHDQWLPDLGGPNATPVDSGEQILFNENTEICLLNDGQVPTVQDVPRYLDTAFSGPSVPLGAFVTAIRFGPSRPKGIYPSCLYLTVSEQLLDSEGPFTWSIGLPVPWSSRPPVFTLGTLIKSKGLKPKVGLGQIWDQTLNLSTVAPSLSIDLIQGIYDTLARTFLHNDSQPVFSLPCDSPQGPTYLETVWPVNFATITPATLAGGSNGANGPSPIQQQPLSSISIRAFIRPVSVPRSSSALSHSIIMNYGEDQEFLVPLDVTTVKVHAFGAGGSSLNAYSGSSGQYATVTQRGLAGKILFCRIGQGGGTGQAYGSHGGLDADGMPLGGGCTFVTLSSLEPIIYAAGGGSGDMEASEQLVFSPIVGLGKPLKYDASHSSGSNAAGGSGLFWGRAGRSKSMGSSGTSYAPNGFVSTSLIGRKYYTPEISIGSTGPAGHGRLVIELLY